MGSPAAASWRPPTGGPGPTSLPRGSPAQQRPGAAPRGGGRGHAASGRSSFTDEETERV